MVTTSGERHGQPIYGTRNDANDDNLYFNGNESGEKGINPLDDITEHDLPKNGELFEGDMIMDEGMRRAVLESSAGNHDRAAVWIAEDGGTRHWPDGVVPYTIDDSLIDAIRVKIPTAIKIFNHFTCVRFVPKKHDDVDYFTFIDGKGCSSSVGRKGGMQTVHLGKGCKRLGTIMHEMMHVLGIIHEQSRPDRDDYLKINFKNIKKGLLTNFQKYNSIQADTLNTPYNYYSIMHYSNYAFSKNDEVTLQSKVAPELDFGQRKMISHLDVVEINKLYPCKAKEEIVENKRCMEIPCEGMTRCCLYQDETPEILRDEIQKRKDIERRNQEAWERVWKDLLFDYQRGKNENPDRE